ncbi:hypothetical protein [Kribbella sp. DT2]|uniref:hypothetical protein n=1 Tax=Kribbella sp. DT2 TaxID=3393427 RepID=UPI003CF9F5DA
MRVRSLAVVSGLALAGLAVAAPTATAAPEPTGSAAAEPAIITLTDAEVATRCVRVLGQNYHSASCYRRAEGNQYRAVVDCTNSGLRFGPWRNQTADLSTVSRINCPAGGLAQLWAMQFRTQ